MSVYFCKTIILPLDASRRLCYYALEDEDAPITHWFEAYASSFFIKRKAIIDRERHSSDPPGWKPKMNAILNAILYILDK